MNYVSDEYLDTLSVMESIKEYASPKSKLSTMIKSQEIVRLKRGVYIYGQNENYSLKTLANKIYGPSYISFEYALSYYNVIPEKVINITSSAMGKNKSKKFETSKGNFFYWSIPENVFSFEVYQFWENESPFLIASKEKALCDLLHKNRNINTIFKIDKFLKEDLRVDLDELFTFNIETIDELSMIFNNRNIKTFINWYNREFL